MKISHGEAVDREWIPVDHPETIPSWLVTELEEVPAELLTRPGKHTKKAIENGHLYTWFAY